MKILKKSPGVIIGMSTIEGYKGTAVFYDGDTQVLEVDLTVPMPSEDTEEGLRPGLDIEIFCKESIKVSHPKGVDISFFID